MTLTATTPAQVKEVLPAARPWPLHDVDRSRAIEAQRLRQRPDGELMALAGMSAARWVLAQAPHAQHIWVAAGPGGNGGDGLHAARHLAAQGRQVVITLHPSPDRLKPATARILDHALAAGCRLSSSPPPPGWADIVVDAMLGLGADRPLEPGMAAAVRTLLGQAVPCLSLDLPTGLNADTGQALGPDWIKAQATLCLLTLKPGLFMGLGRDAAGHLWFDPLDATPLATPIEPTATTVGPLGWPAMPPARAHASHKGSFGDVLVLGGARGMKGALRLAAHAALAAGAGRVTGIPLEGSAALEDVMRPECMWMETEGLERFALEDATVVCGCGGGVHIEPWLPTVLQRAGRLVLDADALNAVARDPALQQALTARASRRQASVITPHPLEAARLLGCSTQEIQSNRLRAARRLSDHFMVTAVLKGSGTIITSPGRLPEVNTTGNGALATGGTGDVLAGWLGGRWSGCPDASASDHLRADAGTAPVHDDVQFLAHRMACEAVWTHGRAADLHGSANALRAADLLERMRGLVT